MRNCDTATTSLSEAAIQMFGEGIFGRVSKFVWREFCSGGAAVMTPRF